MDRPRVIIDGRRSYTQNPSRRPRIPARDFIFLFRFFGNKTATLRVFICWTTTMDKYLGDNDIHTRTQFEAMAMPHLDAAYNLARWLTRNEHDADDLVQSAYLRAFRFADSFRGGDARAWLLTIVRNTYYTSLRDGQPHLADVSFDEELHGAASEHTDAHAGLDPAAIAARRDTSRTVNRALEQLPQAFREVLVLKEMDDLSYKQIAQVAEIPIGTVMSRLARARKMLLACLGNDVRRDTAGD
jgi:RNA polymerase sigma-70 factor (ECF subfamily)